MGRSMRTPRYRYTRWRRERDGRMMGRELYDHTTDPKENTNIAANPKNSALIRQLETELQSVLEISPAGTTRKEVDE